MTTIKYAFTTPTECQIDFHKVYSNPQLLKRALNSYYSLQDSAYFGSYDITDFLYDIENAQAKCHFYDNQYKGFELWKRGYNERQIAETLKLSQQAVHHFISNACKTLSEILER